MGLFPIVSTAPAIVAKHRSVLPESQSVQFGAFPPRQPLGFLHSLSYESAPRILKSLCSCFAVSFKSLCPCFAVSFSRVFALVLPFLLRLSLFLVLTTDNRAKHRSVSLQLKSLCSSNLSLAHRSFSLRTQNPFTQLSNV